MANLSTYQSKAEKDNNYCYNKYIDTEQDLDNELANILAHNDEYLYRGIYDASYMSYASSQRIWILQQDRMTRFGILDYRATIQAIIHLTYSLPEVKAYMQKNNIIYNEFFIMALMQHFGAPAPMLDFSNSVLKGLFFAVDGIPGWIDRGTNELSDYVSLYFIPKSIDWMGCTIQKVMENACLDIEQRVTEYQKQNNTMPDATDVLNDIRHLLYRQFHPSLGNISFLPVGGPTTGRVKVSIPVLNFSCDYEIINSRLVSQEGMFVFNNSLDMPLVELMNNVCKQKYFNCINIRKNLVSYISDRYLNPNSITHDRVYCIGDKESDTLQNAVNLV